MFKVLAVEMCAEYLHGYGDGAKPGMKCAVTLQMGDKSYNKTIFNLSPDAVRRVVKAALDEVQAMMSIDYDSVDVEGSPAPEKPKPEVLGTTATVAEFDEVSPL